MSQRVDPIHQHGLPASTEWEVDGVCKRGCCQAPVWVPTVSHSHRQPPWETSQVQQVCPGYQITAFALGLVLVRFCLCPLRVSFCFPQSCGAPEIKPCQVFPVQNPEAGEPEPELFLLWENLCKVFSFVVVHLGIWDFIISLSAPPAQLWWFPVCLVVNVFWQVLVSYIDGCSAWL